jgi:uncharacterized protein YbjT (DUF2867 family)
MKIVVFGASGRVGQHIVEQALSKGYQVTAFVRRENSLPQNDPNLNIILAIYLTVKNSKRPLWGQTHAYRH